MFKRCVRLEFKYLTVVQWLFGSRVFVKGGRETFNEVGMVGSGFYGDADCIVSRRRVCGLASMSICPIIFSLF